MRAVMHMQSYKRTRNHTNARAMIETHAQYKRTARAIIQPQSYKRTRNDTKRTRNHTNARAIIQTHAQ